VILEGIVTTCGPSGEMNIAPMGARIDADLSLRRFVLRPYRTSTTYRNLKSKGAGVFHLTDDVLLLAQAAIGAPLDPPPRLARASSVAGWVLLDACRYHEFRVLGLRDDKDPTTIEAETLREGRPRDFLGFNRARHAVLEAAILATRTAFLPAQKILPEFEHLAEIVRKTGGEREAQAFRLLDEHVLQAFSAVSFTDPKAPS
jgi:uncharacterized protein